MTDVERLMAAKAEADAALADAEAGLLAELVDAKKAHRKSKSDDSKARLDEAKAQVQAYRQMTRAGRTGLVAGDAFQDNGNED